jgi:broad specificity phosphatase PhoE
VKIILVRHAKVLVSETKSLYASEIKAGIEVYDHAPIDTVIPNKSELVSLAEDSAYLVCSGLSRSVASLALLGHTPDMQDAVFNELAVPSVDWKGVKLAPQVWLLLFRIASLFGYRGGGESLADAKARAVQAVDRLIDSSIETKSTMLLGHGLMNHFIARELKKRGWRETKALGRANWSYGIFESKGTK